MGILDTLQAILSGALFALLYAALNKMLDLKLFVKSTNLVSKKALIEAAIFGIILAVWNELFFHFWPF